MGTLDDNVRVGTRDDAFRIEARRLSAEIERLRAEWRKADDGWIAAKAEADALRAAEAETASVLRELNTEIDGLRAEIADLRDRNAEIRDEIEAARARDAAIASDVEARVRSAVDAAERRLNREWRDRLDDGSDGGPYSRHRDSMG
jgi:chromosome segregation ATPase